MSPLPLGILASGAASFQPLVINYLVIAGGGGASNSFHGGGGGGAGGYLEGTTTLLSPGPYLITVGAGGPGAVKVGDFSNNNGTKGSNSSIADIVVATGGGAGITNNFNSIANGGSGGGGVNGGTGLFGTGTSGQGNNGAGSGSADGFPFAGGGGGGAGQVGQAGQSRLNGGTGGNGLASSITGSSVFRAGGGAGGKGTNNPSGTQTPASVNGGLGGGGNSAPTLGSDGLPGQQNTGGGGGGAGGAWFSPRYGAGFGGNGGSGIVILRYPNTRTITVGAGLTAGVTDQSVGTNERYTTIVAGTGNVSWS